MLSPLPISLAATLLLLTSAILAGGFGGHRKNPAPPPPAPSVVPPYVPPPPPTVYPTCTSNNSFTFNPNSIEVSATSFSAQFTIVLNSPPTTPSVNVYLNAPGFQFSSAQLTFTASNWNTVSPLKITRNLQIHAPILP